MRELMVGWHGVAACVCVCVRDGGRGGGTHRIFECIQVVGPVMFITNVVDFTSCKEWVQRGSQIKARYVMLKLILGT